MKIKLLYISIALLLFKSNVYAFSFGEFESGMTSDNAISITKQSKSKLIKIDNAPKSTVAVEYVLGDERHYIVLEFTNNSNKLFALTISDTKSKDIKKLESKFKKFKAALESIYGAPCIEKHTVAIIGIPKTVSDNPNTYTYENNEDRAFLTYSKKLQLLTVRYTSKSLENTNVNKE